MTISPLLLLLLPPLTLSLPLSGTTSGLAIRFQSGDLASLRKSFKAAPAGSYPSYSDPYTLSFHFKLDTPTSSSLRSMVFGEASWGSDGTQTPSLQIYPPAGEELTDMDFTFGVYFDLNENQVSVTKTFDYTAWHHFAMTTDNNHPTANIKVFIDGENIFENKEHTPSAASDPTKVREDGWRTRVNGQHIVVARL